MRTIIVSDVHIGSRYFLRDRFVAFLRGLPPDASLVLNGDTVDRWRHGSSPGDEEVLGMLREESFRRKVVWIHGNHDENFRMSDSGKIDFQPSYSIGRRLFASHGFDFDNVMPYHRAFVGLFRVLHRVRIWLGADAVHVAHYAKKWKLLYNILLRNVTMNAVEYARENGYEAVTCGHTHYVQDAVVDRVRYINTGSWTETPVYCLVVDDTAITLVEVGPGGLAAPASAS